MTGAVALVGSGEYLPAMQPLEQRLMESGITAGKSPKYVQLATAAGKEGITSWQRWQELGAQQADRLGIEQIFIPAFDRESANDRKYAQLVSDAALIYLSGGDPFYLAQTLRDTLLLNEIEMNWKSGSALAGCSAGAMALVSEIPNPFKLTAAATPGLNLIPNLKVLPHFDRYFGWLPTPVAKYLGKSNQELVSIGIDENTAVFSDGNLDSWEVWGYGSVQLLNKSEKKLLASEEFIISQELIRG
ncbi:MAG: peptidase [Actinobacteria bacterium]|nr:peptidase [Actinomycetota bacterium]